MWDWNKTLEPRWVDNSFRVQPFVPLMCQFLELFTGYC
jgi:hypothetical protein